MSTLVTEFLAFDEGKDFVSKFGVPEVCFFLLAELSIADFLQADTLAGGVGEIEGTGYGRRAQKTPGWSVPGEGEEVVANFEPIEWTTGTSRDWPDADRRVVLVTSPANTGVAIGAYNLRKDGESRDFSGAWITETFTPSLRLGHQK